MVTEDSFKEMQEQQKLMVDFNEYPKIFMKMANSCIREPQSFLAVFIMRRDGKAKLDFIQNIEYKFIELLSCQFQSSSEDAIRRCITYRYNSVKSKLQLMEARLKDVNNLVKVKNPSLLLQLQKANPHGHIAHNVASSQTQNVKSKLGMSATRSNMP